MGLVNEAGDGKFNGLAWQGAAKLSPCETEGVNLTGVIMSKSRFALADIHAFDQAVCDGENMKKRLI